MNKLPVRRKSSTPYWVRFSLVMLGFGGFTSTFVLVVLPRRFILQSGLVESGITFETENLPFQPPERLPEVLTTYGADATSETTPSIGPAERFWSEVMPLLAAEDFETAIPVFAEYLADFPNDVDVLREYAVTLRRANEAESAEAVYRKLIATGDLSYRLALARLLRDRGDTDQALAVYREITADNPDDPAVKLELARTLLWSERYAESIPLLRDLEQALPGELAIRLELARALYWNGLPERAFTVLSGYPSHDSGWSKARPLLAELVPRVAPRVRTLEQLIRQAIESGNLSRAADLYSRMLLREPADSRRWGEWVDFLQYRLEDLEAARHALLSRQNDVGLDVDQRYRLSQLHVWTGHEDAAKAELRSLLGAEPAVADAWALLGELYRWGGDRHSAWDAYQRALDLADDNEVAAAGVREIRNEVDRVVAKRDHTGVDPQLAYFHDSDDFTRLDVGVRAAQRWFTTSVSVRAGYRNLDGPGYGAALTAENGLFAEVEVVRWLRLASVRTSVAAGVQRFDAMGDEPSFSASIEIPDANGASVRAGYSHGPAFPHTATVASVLGGLRSDDFQVSVYRGLGEDWSVAVAATAVSLRGAESNNWRLSGSATASRHVTEGLTAGMNSRVLSHTEASPSLEARRLYWDPSSFWTNSLVLELRTPDGNKWLLFARLTPGVALARERDIAGTQIVPQLGSQAGLEYESGPFSLAADVGYSQTRAGDYNAIAANLRLSIRP